VVLEHDVCDVIAHTHSVLLHAGKNKTYASINEKYHGINRQEVKVLIYLEFGLPKIFQCNNGNEFNGKVLRIVESCGITLIHGRPRHPLAQGLIEQANAELKHKGKSRSRFMRLHVLPLLDLWFAVNAKAYVLTVASNTKIRFMYCLLPYWDR